MKYGKKWGDWEKDELVMALDKSLTAKQVSELTGRSETAVYKIRHKYGYIPKDNKWTVSQEKFLLDHQELSDKQIAMIVNRTPRAVRDKRYKLNKRVFNKDKELYFTPYDGKTIREKRKQLQIEIHDLASYCGVESETIRQAEISDPKYYKTLRMLATIILKDFEDEIISWDKMEDNN